MAKATPQVIYRYICPTCRTTDTVRVHIGKQNVRVTCSVCGTQHTLTKIPHQACPPVH